MRTRWSVRRSRRRSAGRWRCMKRGPRTVESEKRGSAMPEPQRAVTDTHALIFHAAGGGQLGRRAAAFFDRCEHRDAILYVPMAVIWECSLLARVARINLRR